jgi:putative SOS response-associated peptidase YedK
MWADAFRQRRCVIPVSVFYEWGPGGSGGRRQAHEFRCPEDDYLWVAGIWEGREDVGGGEPGRCYSMVTTAASPTVVPIHDRMPALLLPEEVPQYLDLDPGPDLDRAPRRWDFRPYSGDLFVAPCDSPLAKPHEPDAGPELF